MHLTCIQDGIWQSDVPNDAHAVEEAGIRTAVGLVGEFSPDLPPSVRLIRLPIQDGVSPGIEWLRSAVDTVIAALRDGPVLVYCGAGISRSSMLVAAVLMAQMRVGWEKALELVRAARPTAAPAQAFRELLQEYEKEVLSVGGMVGFPPGGGVVQPSEPPVSGGVLPSHEPPVSGSTGPSDVVGTAMDAEPEGELDQVPKEPGTPTQGDVHEALLSALLDAMRHPDATLSREVWAEVVAKFEGWAKAVMARLP